MSMSANAAAAASSKSSSDKPPHTASTSQAALNGPMTADITTDSCWQTDAPQRTFFYPQLQGDDATVYDAVVVGGGIVGVSTAYALGAAGLKVALIEARTVGTGTTGWSTAKITAQQNILYSELAKKHGKETARLYGEMNMAAVAIVEKLDRDLKLESNFKRISSGTWTSVEKKEKEVREEADLCKELGFPVQYLTGGEVAKDLPESIKPVAALIFTDQGVFNPIQYCVALTSHFAKFPGCVVHESTRVTAVAEASSPHTVTAETGSIKAKQVVLATHMPILDRSHHFTFVSPSRSTCIAVELTDKSQLPSVAWVSEELTPMRSMRVGDKGELIVSGESFTQGSVTETGKNYQNLEDWARQHFSVAKVTHRWSSMDFMSSSKLPFIGYLHRGCSTIYCATGMSKWGLGNGVAAGEILRDLIVHGEEAAMKTNKYAAMVDARRWDLANNAAGVMQAGAHTAVHMVKDHVAALFASDISSLKRGEGGLCKVKGESVGAYLDEEGKYHLVKPICTHLGCGVLWNKGDKVWDCPCHGSQFTIDGEVIQGPAVKKLPCMNHIEW